VGGRVRFTAAYWSTLSRDTFRHSISAAMSRSVAVSSLSRTVSAACASRRALLSSSRGMVPPITCGQKKFSCERADAWKVRAETPVAPSIRSLPRSSPAARLVKVSAITRPGE
jgi:hypothetical protein